MSMIFDKVLPIAVVPVSAMVEVLDRAVERGQRPAGGHYRSATVCAQPWLNDSGCPDWWRQVLVADATAGRVPVLPVAPGRRAADGEGVGIRGIFRAWVRLSVVDGRLPQVMTRGWTSTVDDSDPLPRKRLLQTG